jgi:hypothetical protein
MACAPRPGRGAAALLADEMIANGCQAFAQNIRTALAQYPADRRNDVVLLFSAHSLPLEIVK